MIFVIVGIVLYFMWAFGMACVFDSLGLKSWKAFVPVYRSCVLITHMHDDSDDLFAHYVLSVVHVAIALWIVVDIQRSFYRGEASEPIGAILIWIWNGINRGFGTIVFGIGILWFIDLVRVLCIMHMQLAEHFACGKLFGICLTFLPFVFWPILSLKCDNGSTFDKTP